MTPEIERLWHFKRKIQNWPNAAVLCVVLWGCICSLPSAAQTLPLPNTLDLPSLTSLPSACSTTLSAILCAANLTMTAESVTVGAGSGLSLTAGTSITLNPGFHAVAGSSFHAFLSPPDFAVSLSPSQITASPAYNNTFQVSANYTVTVTSLFGFSGTPSLTAAGTVPAGTPVTPGQLTPIGSGSSVSTASYNFTTPSRPATGTYFPAVIATSGSLSHKAAAVFSIPSLQILTVDPLPTATVGVSYPPVTITAAGGYLPYENWIVSALPQGMNYSISQDQNHTSITISGTPTAATQTGYLSIQVVDSSSTNPSVTSSPLLPVQGSGALQIYGPTSSTFSIPLGQFYNQSFSATGGKTSYLWSISSGTLPPGLTFNPSVNHGNTASLSGTPTSGGQFSFTVQLTDSSTPQQTIQAHYTITVGGSLLITSGSPLPGGAVGTAYSTTLAASGGTQPYTWSVPPGALPLGLSLSATTGVLSGTPTSATGSPWAFTVTLTDSTSGTPLTASQNFTLAIVPALTISQSALPNATATIPYSQSIVASGGVPPYTWSVASGYTLPSWLGFSTGGTNGNTAMLSGTPTSPTTTPYNFSLQVADSTSKTLTQNYNLTVAPTGSLAVTCSGSSSPTVGQPVTFTATGSGGYPPYSYSWSGAVSGTQQSASFTPTAAGTYTAQITITDSNNGTNSSSCSVNVQPQTFTMKEYIRIGDRIIAVENHQ